MLEKNDRAFKEWTVIVKALASGRQSLILRKGGIAEEAGSFELENREFFLFPTYFHQQESGVIPEERIALADLKTEAASEGILSIAYYAVVDKALQAGDIQSLKSLRGKHIWADSVVEERFNYGLDKSLYVLLVRVYRLPQAAQLSNLERYGGCKSWVTLEHPISTAGAVPVLDDRVFSDEARVISELLGGSE